MLLPLLFTAVISAPQAGPVQCPMMSGPANMKGSLSEYKGVKYGYCCPGCEKSFLANPDKALTAAKGRITGEFLFDPVSKMRIDAPNAKGSADFAGTRYYFASSDNKAKFDANPKAYATVPAKEVLHCAVMGKDLKSYSAAGGYFDRNGVRYYMCCGGCVSKFAGNATSFAEKAASKVASPKALKVDKTATGCSSCEDASKCKDCDPPPAQ